MNDGYDILPEHMRAGMRRYLDHGLLPGDFLRAVLEGNLFEALRRADDININALPAYGRFLHNHAPAGCYGDREKVRAWHERGGVLGRMEAA